MVATVKPQPLLVFRFIGAHDPTSLLIEWITGGLWCHVEMLSRDGKHWIGAHAITGIQARPLDWCKPTRERCYGIPVKPGAYENAQAFMESKLGAPYGYWACLSIMLRKRMWRPGQEICSQFAIETAWQAGLMPLNVLPEYDPKVTPEMVHLSPLFIGRSIHI